MKNFHCKKGNRDFKLRWSNFSDRIIDYCGNYIGIKKRKNQVLKQFSAGSARNFEGFGRIEVTFRNELRMLETGFGIRPAHQGCGKSVHAAYRAPKGRCPRIDCADH